MTAEPVRISMHVEFPGGGEDETYEIARAEWDAMTPAERTADIERAASDHAAEYVGWGWHIDDPDDYAATGGAR